MRKAIVFLLSLLVLTTASLTETAIAQEWPQWRGPMRDGTVVEFAEPKAWPEQLKLKWKVKVGTGHSSPVVSGRRVYLHSRDGEHEVVRAVDLATGKQFWQDSYTVAYTVSRAAAAHGKGPRATPAVADGKLYTFGITGILSCYDIKAASCAGARRLRVNSIMPSPTMVIVNAGGNSGALMAYNAETGEEKWSCKTDSASYASPIVANFGGREWPRNHTDTGLIPTNLDLLRPWQRNNGLHHHEARQ